MKTCTYRVEIDESDVSTWNWWSEEEHKGWCEPLPILLLTYRNRCTKQDWRSHNARWKASDTKTKNLGLFYLYNPSWCWRVGSTTIVWELAWIAALLNFCSWGGPQKGDCLCKSVLSNVNSSNVFQIRSPNWKSLLKILICACIHQCSCTSMVPSSLLMKGGLRRSGRQNWHHNWDSKLFSSFACYYVECMQEKNFQVMRTGHYCT